MSVADKMIGQFYGEFGQLEVLRVSNKTDSSYNKYVWIKCCTCGIEKEVNASYLKTGRIKSCGNTKICQDALIVKDNGYKEMSIKHTKHKLIGEFFGEYNQLEVLRLSNTTDIYKTKYVVIKCHDCGIEKEAQISNLLFGRIKSCGNINNCSSAKTIKDIGIKIRSIHGLSYIFGYQILQNAIHRCYDPNNWAYKHYGGRLDNDGNPNPVTVYDPWRKNAQLFIDYILSDQMPESLDAFKLRCPGQIPTIDRINTRIDNYEPGSIKWSTYQEQNQNTTINVLNPELVRFIRIEHKSGKSGAEIFRLLKTNYNYQGSTEPVYAVIQGKTWTNIT